jgi:hypothetical protein
MNRFCPKCGHYFNPEPDPLPAKCPACGLEGNVMTRPAPIPTGAPDENHDAWLAAGHAFGRWIMRHVPGERMTHEQAWQATSAALRAFAARQAVQSPVVDR